MPNNKMERFTPRARRVLSLAQEEAERLQHNYIGTEHMLLGLLREEGGVAGRVLSDLGLEQQRVEELIEELTRATVRPTATTAELSPGTKRVIELAVDEARRMGHHAIGTEHLLLGLVRQSDGVAIDVLKRLGLSPAEVRRQTRRVLQERPIQPEVSPQPSPSAPSKPVRESSLTDEIKTEPKQSSQGDDVDAVAMLEKVIIRILQMIEDQKITISQGVELVNSLTPDLKLLPSKQAELVSAFFDLEKLQDYRVRLALVDSKGAEKKSETVFPLPKVLNEIDRFLTGILNNPDTPMVFKLGDSAVEIRIVNDKDKPDE